MGRLTTTLLQIYVESVLEEFLKSLNILEKLWGKLFASSAMWAGALSC